ncbi:MAG: hypothetical protein L0Z50_30385 [Verrucomicrobiales bacterium]|nr:hypothetical protein [Verrucomicrobiales bacterium]
MSDLLRDPSRELPWDQDPGTIEQQMAANLSFKEQQMRQWICPLLPS